MKMKTKHSKYKNTGLLFELLIKQITHDLLKETAYTSNAKNILKRYFNPKTELYKEYTIYETIMGLQGKNKGYHYVSSILNEALLYSKEIDMKKLWQEKYDLIKAVREHYTDSFFNVTIPTYKQLASIYRLLQIQENKNVIPAIGESTHLKESLIDHLTSKPTHQINEDRITEDVDKLTLKLVYKNFNQKYKSLSADQKGILREYLNTANNKTESKYITFMRNKLNDVKSKLYNHIDTVEDDAIKIKLNETVKHIASAEKKLEGGKISSNLIPLLLLSYQLHETIIKD